MTSRNEGEAVEEGEFLDREVEMMMQLRMFYLGVINNMQKNEVERQDGGVKMLVDRSKEVEKELEMFRDKVGIMEARKKDLSEQSLMIKRETECMEMIRKEGERKHLEVLLSFQKKLKNCLTEMSNLRSSSLSTPETSPELSLYTKMFPAPSQKPSILPNTSPITGLLQFSNLFCLSGQLVQFCQGQHGSKLVQDRLRKGTEPERDLVREELRLPCSLFSILETGNKNCIDVVLVLAETDKRSRVELMELVDKNRGIFLRFTGGEEFVKRMFTV